MKEKCKTELFGIELFPRIHLFQVKKVLSNFAVTISQWTLELEKLELLPPDPPGPQDIPHRRVARPELAGAPFRYINCLENLQSFLNSTDI